jgi:hypothetical protein
MEKAPSGATSKTNEQRRSENCGWRNLPPRWGLADWWRVSYKDTAPDGAGTEGVERMVMIVMAATEWRKKVAHSVSRGLGVLFETSSVGAAENTGSLTGNFLSPFQGFARFISITHGLHRGLPSIAAPQLNL